MNQKQVIATFSKCLGLYFLAEALLMGNQGLSITIWHLFATDTIGFGINGVYIWVFVVNLIISALLIFKSDYISARIASGTEGAIEISVTKADFIEIAVIAIGVFIVARAIPELLNKLMQYLYFNEFDKEEKTRFFELQNRKAELWFSLAKLAVGIIAIGNGKILAKLLTQRESIKSD